MSPLQEHRMIEFACDVAVAAVVFLFVAWMIGWFRRKW